ncbi:putative sporulation protein YtxC [Bacillaceae bacterium S4-13-58]
MDIYFERKEEVLLFCKILLENGCKDKIGIQQKRSHRIALEIEPSSYPKKNIARVLARVFIQERERQWIREIIQDCYYFEDKEEVAHIEEVCHSILKGQYEKNFFNHSSHEEYITSLFLERWQEERSFLFESFLRFRLQDYKKELIELVGVSIEDYKREQEYQTFIHSLRHFIGTQDSKLNYVNFHIKEPELIYEKNGKLVDTMKLEEWVRNLPLYLFNVNEGDHLLASLLAMNPEKIEIFSDDPSEPKLLTVINIFQERVSILPASSFPFLKKNIKS